MNKYLIISNNSIKANAIEKKIKSVLTKEWILEEDNPKYIFIIGGDGTFLKNLEKVNKLKDVFVIPINGGNFGFYSYFNIDNLKSILKYFNNKNNYYKPLLINTKMNKKEYKSINEVLLTKNKTLMVKIDINNITYQKFIGTGIMVSTPTGSTGRNKSAGGAIIFPNMDLVQLLEIEAINQKGYNTLMAPIILDHHSKIKISIFNNEKDDKSFLINDGQTIINKNDDNIEITFEKSNFYLFKPNDTKSYIKKLRKAFISGG